MALLAAEEHNFEFCSFKITDHYTELFFAEFHKKQTLNELLNMAFDSLKQWMELFGMIE